MPGDKSRCALLLAVAAGVLLLAGCAGAGRNSQEHRPLFLSSAERAPVGPVGPTLRLDYKEGNPGNPIGGFMYCVPLVSPELVSIVESPGNHQRVQVITAARGFTPNSFSVACEFEISGEGWHRNEFDHTDRIRRYEQKLKEGGTLERVLHYINIEGPGSGVVEVDGVVTNRVPTVTEVRLRFNAHGRTSPVTIGLIDIRSVNGAIQMDNEIVARANVLTFQRTTGRPRMGVTLSSVKRKDAGDSAWQKLKGGITAAVANVALKPLAVEPAGHAAMLEFGYALAAADASFTFPRARNLKSPQP